MTEPAFMTDERTGMPRFGAASNANEQDAPPPPQSLSDVYAMQVPQERFNLEMFRALELLGRKLERVEGERDTLAQRLTQIESATAVDEHTGRLYLPAVIEQMPKPTPLERHAVRWSVGAALVSCVLAMGALGLVVFRAPVAPALSARQLAALDALNGFSAVQVQKLASIAPAAGDVAPVHMPPQPAAAQNSSPQPVVENSSQVPAALQTLADKALKGDGAAAHDLGTIYAAGTLVPQNFTQAATWFTRAAKAGVANAAYNLGVMAQQGLGMEKNPALAVHWYDVAAKQGHPQALYNLGLAYTKGMGTARDMAKGADYFKQAAKAGVAQAAYNLGVLYEDGALGTPDALRARQWYEVAASQGHGDAKAALARMEKLAAAALEKTTKQEAQAAARVEPAAGTPAALSAPTAEPSAAISPGAAQGLTPSERAISVPAVVPAN